jgi:hypothetical protein
VLAPLGYDITQKGRVLDAIEAAAENPAATWPVGPSVLDQLVPVLVAGAGPLGPSHPWLRPGDWDYAFKAHFDFVIHAPLGERWATQPLFAVEFDGPNHAAPAAQLRDCRKNRLCAAAGLPLVRLDPTFLYRRERLSLVRWLAELWVAYRKEMPGLIAERDAEVAAISPGELETHSPWLLGELPHLDVNLVFGLQHPFPPIRSLAERLARVHSLLWKWHGAVPNGEPRWWAKGTFAILNLDPGFSESWHCKVWIGGPNHSEVELTGLFELPGAYPLEPGDDGTDPHTEDLLAGRLPWLPAGPWPGASSIIGEALCTYNSLVEVDHWLRVND